MPRTTGPYPALLIALALAACSDFPEIEATNLDDALSAPYPVLVPLEQALTPADTTPRLSQEEARCTQRAGRRACRLRPRQGAPRGRGAAGAPPGACRSPEGSAATGDEIDAMRQRLAALSPAG